jgi:hypothetical protein
MKSSESNFNEENIEILTEDLGKFLDYPNREKEARQDGYFMHTTEFLTKKKIGFVSEFQRLVEKRIDELKEERLKCRTLLTDLVNSESTFVEKIKIRLELCEEYILDLENQKSLSINFEGLVKSIIYTYEAGYDLGMNDYLHDNALLNPIRRL